MSGYWGDLVKIVCRAATKRQHWHADFASHRPSRLFATGFWFLRVYHIAQHSPIMDSESSMASTPTLNTGKLTQPWRQPGDYFNHRTPHCSFSLRFLLQPPPSAKSPLRPPSIKYTQLSLWCRETEDNMEAQGLLLDIFYSIIFSQITNQHKNISTAVHFPHFCLFFPSTSGPAVCTATPLGTLSFYCFIDKDSFICDNDKFERQFIGRLTH